MEKQKIYKSKSIGNIMINPGDSSELPDDFLNVAVFVDNAYLIRLKNYFFKKKFRYNLKDFILEIARECSFWVKKILVYDAPPYQSGNPSEEENRKKEKYDKFANFFKKQGIVLREGRTQRLKVNDEFIYRQKGVDMLLGIDAVSVKIDFPDVSGIVLLTGDSDFVPLIEKLGNLDISVYLWTYFDRIRKSPFSKSNHLINSVGDYFKIDRKYFLKAEIKKDGKKNEN